MNPLYWYEQFVTFGIEMVSEQDAISTLKYLDRRYADGTPDISDSEYDTFYAECKQQYPTAPYFKTVGSDVRTGKEPLPYPMGSLTQSYLGEVQDWVKKWNLQNEVVVISAKKDGASWLGIYNTTLQKTYSRGNGMEGASTIRHSSKITNLPKRLDVPGHIAIRAEAIISKSNFEEVRTKVTARNGQQYKTPRNMISGIMNATSNPDVVYNYVDIIAYEVIDPPNMSKLQQLEFLKNAGFKVPSYVVLKGSELTDNNLTRILNEFRDTSEYILDGIVLDVDSLHKRLEMNPSTKTLNPEFARKYKVAGADNMVEATVDHVEWNLSKDGFYKPRVVFEPFELLGVTVTYCTGHNAKTIVDNQIGPGAVCLVTRAGDITPYITEVLAGASVELPTDGQWNDTKVDWIKANSDDDDIVKCEQLKYFFNSIDIDGLADGNIVALYNAGLKTPEDVLNSYNDLNYILGAIADRVAKSIAAKFSNIPEWLLMGAHPAFGRGVGRRKMKAIFEAVKGDMSKCADVELISNIDDFGEKTAQKIAAGYPKYLEFLKKVEPGIITFQPYEPPKTGVFAGQTVVLTGFRDKALQEKIEKSGGKIGSSVSRNTTLLIAQDPHSNSGKMKTARDLGIAIISPTEAWERLR